MRCVDKKRWLAYLKGELKEHQRRRLKMHLKQCSRCRKLAQELSFSYQALDVLDGLEPDIGFTTRVVQRARDRRQLKGWRRVILPAVATTIAVLSVALGIFLGQNIYVAMESETSSPTPEQTAYRTHENMFLEFYNQTGGL